MIERKIIIGLITSSEYCQKIKSIWNVKLIESQTAKLLANWCWEYYNQFEKSPGKDIEAIFYSKLKATKISKDIAEEIEQEILPGLSDQSVEEEFNLKYLVTETEKYFNQRSIQVLADSIQILVTKGELEDANKLIREFKPVESIIKLDDYIVTVEKIREQKIPPPKTLLKSWLKEGQLTILYGNFGSGKSLLSIHISYILGLNDYQSQEAEIGEWEVNHPTGCLYLDGELGEKEMDERIKTFEWLGKQTNKFKLKIFSIPDYQLKTEDSFFLSQRKNQLQIIKWLKDHPNYKLIVLDSASTLFGLVEENDNSEWSNKMNPFLRDLRALGVACLMLHHSGKDGKRGLRGASAMGAMAHNIFRLVPPIDKNVDKGEAVFKLIKDKQRSGGKSFNTFTMHYFQNDEKTKTEWEIT